MKTIAIILLAVGILMTAFTGFTLVTKKKVVDVGPVEVNKTEKTPIYWSPITGLILTGAGVALLIFSNQKKSA